MVPLLATSLGIRLCGMEVSETLEWVDSDIALGDLSVETDVEMLAYYAPWADSALGAISLPLVAIAGAMITADVLPDMAEIAQWRIRIIDGACSASTV